MTQTRSPGRPPIYPWDSWLDGQDHLLVPGVDFPADKDVKTLRTQILNAAKRKGAEITTSITEDGSIAIFLNVWT